MVKKSAVLIPSAVIPLDNEWRVAIKKVDGGLFSTFANEQFKAR